MISILTLINLDTIGDTLSRKSGTPFRMRSTLYLPPSIHAP